MGPSEKTYYVGCALQGLANRLGLDLTAEQIAHDAVKIADATMAALAPPAVDLQPEVDREKTINFDD